jgi:hypothetical protein
MRNVRTMLNREGVEDTHVFECSTCAVAFVTRDHEAVSGEL